MNTEEKLVVARQLLRLNVDVIEAGFPISSPGDFESVRRIAELAGIAFDDGCGDGCNLVVKTADKLRALELLYKYLGLGDKGGGLDKVVIVDDVGGDAR